MWVEAGVAGYFLQPWRQIQAEPRERHRICRDNSSCKGKAWTWQFRTRVRFKKREMTFRRLLGEIPWRRGKGGVA